MIALAVASLGRNRGIFDSGAQQRQLNSGTALRQLRWAWGEMSMSGLRYDRILASTALALVLAAPASAYATPPNDGASKLAAVPTANAMPTPGSETLAPAPAAALPGAPDSAGGASVSGAGATPMFSISLSLRPFPPCPMSLAPRSLPMLPPRQRCRQLRPSNPLLRIRWPHSIRPTGPLRSRSMNC